MEQLSPLQASALALVKRYIERQSIVYDALKELRPHFVMRLENPDASIPWSTPPRPGYWGENDEWEYFVHGPGCRLTHRVTGERIEWDAGNLNTFDLDWFINHLQWRLKQKNLDDDLRTIRAVLEGAELTEELSTHQRMDQTWKWRGQFQLILEPLCEMGLLTRSEHRHRYTVIN